uniref:Transketolase N-terminal domain-containing protein n=1 Tax=Ananas comosus var. bracteatus TaxID=296719 RepID=A0A6V7P8U1_ANACO|nr:unnamed protein product [Ananas comosus var. bracteatus]
MGCAPTGQVLYNDVMRFNPKNAYWFNCDRFVLFAGHGCMFNYALSTFPATTVSRSSASPLFPHNLYIYQLSVCTRALDAAKLFSRIPCLLPYSNVLEQPSAVHL